MHPPRNQRILRCYRRILSALLPQLGNAIRARGIGPAAIFRNKGVNRVLDASCGAGTQAISLAQLGFDVVATDPSPGMLRKAQEIMTQYELRGSLEFHRVDFLHLEDVVSGPFDAIVTKGNALPHLITDEEIELTLHIFFELLRPGGTLVIGMRDFGPFMKTARGSSQASPTFLTMTPNLLPSISGNGKKGRR